MEMSRRENIIAGPCSADTKENLFEIVKQLYGIGIRKIRVGFWKPRTKPGGFEGIGEEGLMWLSELKNTYPGIQIATEVATAEHLEIAMRYGVDIPWIGARTTTDPFAIIDIASALFNLPKKLKENKTLLIKNPVCPDLNLWEGAYLRLKDCGIKNIGFIHRGFKTYEEIKYRNNPVWKIPMQLKLKYPDMKIYCDPSHIAGDKFYVEEVMKQAKAFNFDGFIVETHIHPDEALSDAAQQITPSKLDEFLTNLEAEVNVDNQDNSLMMYRTEIDEIDHSLLNLLSKRMEISKNIGTIKKEHQLKIFQPDRLKLMLEELKTLGKSKNLSPEFVENIWMDIHDESIKVQKL